MSYTVAIGQEIAQVSPHTEGGTIAVGGSTEARMDVTYNYGWYYHLVFGENGIRHLKGMHVGQSLPLIANAIYRLSAPNMRDQYNADKDNDHLDTWTEPDDYYWKPTPENALAVLKVMMIWGLDNINGIWYVD